MLVLLFLQAEPRVDGGLELFEDREMPGEVCREDVVDEDLPEVALVLSTDVLEDVVFFFLDDLEGERAVVVFEDALVVVDERLTGAHGHHEGVVEAGVADVVDRRADEKSGRLELRELQATGVSMFLNPQDRKNAQELVTSMAWIELW